MTPDIEIVTHVWAATLEQYAQLWRLQAASILRDLPTARVQLRLFWAHEDRHTARVIEWAHELFARQPRRAQFSETALEPKDLFRRAIGRNAAGLTTEARYVWYADADYCFAPEALDALAATDHADAALLWPREILISESHAEGDRLLAQEARDDLLPNFRHGKYARRRQRIAIGGCQIAGGDFARAHGYLDGTRWLRSVKPEAGFRSCRCDRAYRSWIREDPRGDAPRGQIELPGVHRIRHTPNGRDYDYIGHNQGKKVW